MRIVFSMFLVASFILVFPQTYEDSSCIEIEKWELSECDNSYDPYLLKSRISRFESVNGNTLISINFSDQCCPTLKPKIILVEDSLKLYPYIDASELECFCQCCFTLDYEISGLTGKKYNVFFKDIKVEETEDPYELVEPKFEIYKGRKINQSNKYGFEFGTWVKFFANDSIETIAQYPRDSFIRRPYKESWKKRYDSTGVLRYYQAEDTMMSWNEKGELRSERIHYTSNDTSYIKKVKRYSNGQLAINQLSMRFNFSDTSQFDSTFITNGSTTKDIYNEAYYRDGRMKYEGGDTAYSWYENGKLKSKRFNGTYIAYDSMGKRSERIYSWKESGGQGKGDLSKSLKVTYDEDSVVSEIELRITKSYNTKKYHWKWNKNGMLIESPENWQEPLPWERFEDIKKDVWRSH